MNTTRRMECPFCKADLSVLHDRGADAIEQDSCDHLVGVVDMALNTVYGPLTAHVTDFASLVEDAFAKRLGQKVTWDNLEIQSLWESVQEQNAETPDEMSAALGEAGLYRFVLGFFAAKGGELVGPEMYSPDTWRFMYAAKPEQTIDGALAMLRSELENVSVEAKPLTANYETPTSELLQRGWTRTLIRRFMPEPDGKQSVAHWANFQGTPTYFALRVWEIEQSEEFGKAFLRSWKGRMKGRKPEDALAKLRQTPKPE